MDLIIKRGLPSSPFFLPSKMKAIIVNRNYNSHYAKMLVHIYFLIKELPHKIRLAGSRPMAAELIRMEDC